MRNGLQDDMFTPDVIADPYAYYGRLRDEDPVHWNEKYEVWVVTRHDDLVWRTIGTGSWSGEFRGKPAIIEQIFRPLNRALAERATLTTGVIDGGDVVVVQARGRNLTRKGERYDNDYAFVLHFRDGRIARYEEYCDTALIDRVLGERTSYLDKPA